MDFSHALGSLKNGRCIARSGWNGKGMWLTLVAHYGVSVVTVPYEGAIENPLPSNTRLLPWIGMKTADGGFVPWLASQTDILADDWEVV